MCNATGVANFVRIVVFIKEFQQFRVSFVLANFASKQATANRHDDAIRLRVRRSCRQRVVPLAMDPPQQWGGATGSGGGGHARLQVHRSCDNDRRADLQNPSRHVFASMPASSDGGSAVHMKCPDVIGREAGSGTTQDWKGPNVFRACPK